MIVYIAGPYTGDGSHADRSANTLEAIRVADRVARNMNVTVEIPHLSHYWDQLFPHDYKFWIDQCLTKVGRCDALLRMPGDSPGADREVEEARRCGVPVFFCEHCLAEWFRRNRD